jgi:hypothetical protein
MRTLKLTGEKLVNLFLLLLSGFYLYYTLTHNKIGVLRLPKEGFMPLILGIGMVGLSGFLTVQAFCGKGDAAKVRFPIEWWRFGAIVALSLLYAVTLRFLGYPLGSFLFLFALLKLSRVRGLWLPLCIALVTAAAFTLIFKVGLGVMLPAGFPGL